MFDSDPLFCLFVIWMLIFIYWGLSDVSSKLDEIELNNSENEDDSYE